MTDRGTTPPPSEPVNQCQTKVGFKPLDVEATQIQLRSLQNEVAAARTRLERAVVVTQRAFQFRFEE